MPALSEAKTFCSITVNSSDETQVFRKSLERDGFNFVELVPSNSKDPSWFKKACDSGVKCDVLLISGHFGGLFYGQGTSMTVGVSEMEQASCQKTCDGILKHPKEVFLMGCNTLATQTKDHRTINQYLDILIEDGIPLSFAEQVAASRYSQQGFSLEKRFSAIFNQATKIYGFSSTGPLGPYAAARLKPYLAQIPSYSQHLQNLTSKPNQALINSFKGLSFRETAPQLTVDAKERDLFCALRSEDPRTQGNALIQIVETGKTVSFFDSLASYVKDLPVTINQWIPTESAKKILQQSLDVIAKKNKELVTIQYDVTRVSHSVGLISEAEKIRRLEDLLDQAYSQNLTYAKVSQICGILKQEPLVSNLNVHRIVELSEKSPFFMLTLMCQKNLTRSTKDFLIQKIASPRAESERTLALMIMKNHWDPSDLGSIMALLRTQNQTLKARIYLSARQFLAPYKDSILGPFNGLSACIRESEKKGGQSLGTNWGCLTDNTSELSVDVCDHFANLNGDPENADDMRWYCWSQTKSRLLSERAECYALASVMGILGNQMKHVWNCGHR